MAKAAVEPKVKKPKRETSLSTKRAIAGYIFLIPFIIGFLIFFLNPLVKSFNFSLNKIDIVPTGYTLTFSGLEYYNKALFIDANFKRQLTTSVQDLLLDLPLIVIFSFFAATLLNKAFKGRGVARAIFFLPVILTSGVIIGVETSDLLLNITRSSFQQEVNSNPSSSVMQAFELRNLLTQANMPTQFITYIVGAVDRMYSIIIASGVQILIFLSALQSIPHSLYEASNIEGATGWENFWKITLPMVSPYILVNTVYTVIDSFTKPSNQVMTTIKNEAFKNLQYSFSSAMSWIYFVLIGLILLVLTFVISRFVFYYD